jgi:hypothetical protein
VALDPLIINRDDIPKRTRCNLNHGSSFLLSWLRLATTSSARFGAAGPYLFVRKILYVIRTKYWQEKELQEGRVGLSRSFATANNILTELPT